MEKFKVIAKEDLNIHGEPHTWTKGLEYEVVQHKDCFTLTSDQGQVNYYNLLKDEIHESFKVT